MGRKNKKNKQEPGMQPGNVQHIVQGGDTVATALPPISASMGMNHGTDRELREDLKRQNKELNKQYKALQAERKDIDLEREAVALLASQDPSNPEVIRRTTLLRLKCEGLEIRDRALARERSEINRGLQHLPRNGSQQNKKQQHPPKKGKGKGKQKMHEGIQHSPGTLSWGNSWDNNYLQDESEMGNASAVHGVVGNPQMKLEEGEIEDYFENDSNHYGKTLAVNVPLSCNAPASQAVPYDYTANASAMLADLGDKFNAHKGIHPSRLLNLATEDADEYTLQDISEQIPAPCGTSSNNVPVGQKSRFNFSRSLVTPRPVVDNRDAPSPDAASFPKEIQGSGFNFSSKFVCVRPENGSPLLQTTNLKPLHNTNIQKPGFEYSHSPIQTKYEDGSNTVQSPKWMGLPPTSIQGPEIGSCITSIQPETVSENEIDHSGTESLPNTGFQTLADVAETTHFPSILENDLHQASGAASNLSQALPA